MDNHGGRGPADRSSARMIIMLWQRVRLRCDSEYPHSAMYLAILREKGRLRFELRQSYPKSSHIFAFRTIYDLGPDPSRHYELYDSHIVLFSAPLVKAAETALGRDAENTLEQLLFPFLPADTRKRINLFNSRKTIRLTPLSQEEQHTINEQIHIVDRRRMYYLRYGAVDQGRLYQMNDKCLRPLLHQSRDEREFYFAGLERILKPRQYFQYMYAIFNLQQYFTQSFAPWLPEALADEAIADHFLAELCALSGDDRFWQGPSPKDLPPHLTRYVMMFFDYQPEQPVFFNDYLRRFMADHRTFRWPGKKETASPEQVSSIFARPYADLKKMSRAELTRLFRQKAMELHPDQGGNHDRFIELTNAYKSILRRK